MPETPESNPQLAQIIGRLDEHDRRFDEHDRRFDAIDQRFDRLEAKVDTLASDLSSLSRYLKLQFESLQSTVSFLAEQMSRFIQANEALGERVVKLEGKQEITDLRLLALERS